jgi:hypothetical protein
VRDRQQLGRRIRHGLQWGLFRPLVRKILISRPVYQPLILIDDGGVDGTYGISNLKSRPSSLSVSYGHMSSAKQCLHWPYLSGQLHFIHSPHGPLISISPSNLPRTVKSSEQCSYKLRIEDPMSDNRNVLRRSGFPMAFFQEGLDVLGDPIHQCRP